MYGVLVCVFNVLQQFEEAVNVTLSKQELHSLARRSQMAFLYVPVRERKSEMAGIFVLHKKFSPPSAHLLSSAQHTPVLLVVA